MRITYDVSTITGPLGVGTNNLSQLRLLVDDDGDFSSGATILSPTSTDAINNTVSFLRNFNTGQYYTLASVENAALPVTLISFSAQAQENGQVRLNWSTASEVSNSFFTVERSQDGINFELIGTREGAGNSDRTINYEFTDLYPEAGANFYRLKQTDFNGEFEYSEVLRVFVNANSGEISFRLFPNPVSKNQELTLEINGGIPANNQLQYEIVSLKGRKLLSGELEIERNRATINIGHWNSGLYLLRINGEGYTPEVIRFIIQ